MSIEFHLPAVGENVDKADIGSLRVAVGDVITADQIVMEIETDKAVFELPCPHAGKITKIHVKAGDSVKTGALLLTIDESAAAAGGRAAPQPAPAQAETPASQKAPPPAPAKPATPPPAPATPAAAGCQPSPAESRGCARVESRK